MQELIARRARLAEQHDAARSRFQHADPQFAELLLPVVAGLDAIYREMLRTGAPALEMGRTLMWLGDAQFDLAQGQHLPLQLALDSYRRAAPYVDAAADTVVTAKFDANFANILLKGEKSRAVLDEICRRCEAALPVLRASVPAAVAHTTDFLRMAQAMRRDFEAYAAQSELASREVARILRDLGGHGLPPAKLGAIQGRLEQLQALGGASTIADLARHAEQVQALLREVMALSPSDHPRAGRAGVVSRLTMHLWQALAEQVLNAHVDKGARDRACELTRTIVEQQPLLSRTDDAGAIALERARLRALAADARRVLYRSHLTWASPTWAISQQLPDPNGVYLNASVHRQELAEICVERGLVVLGPTTGLPVADAQFDAIRRASVVVASLLGSAEQIAAASYDVGIALVLGKPLVVVAAHGVPVAFDIDVVPVVTPLDQLDTAGVGAAIDAALYVPQRPPSPGELHSLADAVRQRFTDQLHLADELDRCVAAPMDAASVLAALVSESNRANGGHRIVTYSAWPRSYDGAQPYVFHVMPFRADWSDRVAGTARSTVHGIGMRYLRHDDVDSPHIISSLWQTLCAASHVLVDLTGLNPNVALECGIAHTLGKHVRLVGQPGTVARLFPALRTMRVAEYRNDQELADEVRHVAAASASQRST